MPSSARKIIVREKTRTAAARCLALAVLCGIGAAAYAGPAVPVGENLELTTQINTPLEGVLTARAGEDAELTFYLTTKPIRGELLLSADGRFVYTPKENRKGRDYFGYRVRDDRGGTSEEATVLIRITKSG